MHLIEQGLKSTRSPKLSAKNPKAINLIFAMVCFLCSVLLCDASQATTSGHNPWDMENAHDQQNPDQKTGHQLVALDRQALVAQFTQSNHVVELQANLQLPKQGPHGSDIKWFSNNPQYLSTSGEIKRPEYYQADESVILSALISNGESLDRLNIQFSVLAKKPMQTLWQMTSRHQQLIVPAIGSGFLYAVDWGDGTPLQTGITGDAVHVFSEPGSYTVRIGGVFPRIVFQGDLPDWENLVQLIDWGDMQSEILTK